MNRDFRICTGLSKNPKFRHLAARVGGPERALWLLYRLWEFTALYRPEGDLTGIVPEEIGATHDEWSALFEARGRGSPSGFLVRVGDGVYVHDWKEIQPYAAEAPERVARARLAGQASAAVRKAKEREIEERAQHTLEGLILARSDTGASHLTQFQRPRNMTDSARTLDNASPSGQPTNPNFGRGPVIVVNAGDRPEKSKIGQPTGHTQELDTVTVVVPGVPGENDDGHSTLFPLLPPENSLYSEVSPSLGGDTESMSKPRGLDVAALELRPVPAGVPIPSRRKDLVKAQLEEWLEQSFEWFWGIYPRREAKVRARKAWRHLHRDLLAEGMPGITHDVRKAMALDIRHRLRSGEWEPKDSERRQYVPLPATYLNQRRWEDER